MAENTKTPKDPKTLYYYCSLETFFSIFSNGSIRLTEIGKSNDSLEQRFLSQGMVKKIHQLAALVSAKQFDYDKLEKLKKELLEQIDKDNLLPVWAMCFSEKGDDLSQWRGYADDANGMCIGFNVEYLDAANALDTLNYNDFMRFRKVEYGEEAINNFFTHIKKEIWGQFTSEGELENLMRRKKDDLYYCPYYKMQSFAEEKEWRIVYSINDYYNEYEFPFDSFNKTERFNKNFEIHGRRFEIRRGYLQSYIEIKILDFRRAIDKIYIGPKSKVNVSDIKSFIASELCEMKDRLNDDKFIEKSSATYR